MKAADLFVKSLEASDIKYVFGVPGEENLALLEAIRKSSIEMITTRDEQTAVFMAATVGRLTGRVGVALSTLGPGATNLVTGVAYAQLGAMPLLVITGQKPIKRSKQGKFQIVDVIGMMKPLTKFNETIISADKVPSSVYNAIRTAEKERPGATHLEFPEDIAEEESDAKPIRWQKLRRPIPDEKSINSLVEELEKAKSPILLLGSGANRKLIRKQLTNFINKTNIPFISTQMGKGVVDESDPRYIGTAALSNSDFVHAALKYADLILMVGHDIVEKPPVLDTDVQKIVHIDFSAADIDDIYTPDLEIIGDISYALWAVTEQIDVQDWNFDKFYLAKTALEKNLNGSLKSDAFPIKPQRFVSSLRSILPKDAMLSLDNGMYKLWIARNYPAYEQNTVLLDNALATMGAGLGSAMAAKLLFPEKKVVVVAGDGGFLMNVADLETAHRLKLDITIVLVRDDGYGMIRWKQDSMKLADYGLSFSNPDFVKLAESFGAKGYKPGSPNEFESVLKQCLDTKGINIIDLPIDYSENNKYFGEELIRQIKDL
ncbi:MAG TPA: acetolactate synthase large subunit [Candidatus Saccharimonadales bacterium]|nr:acetolactate synthase large subunit [Candidatus Saccharimonadales bacterium]